MTHQVQKEHQSDGGAKARANRLDQYTTGSDNPIQIPDLEQFQHVDERDEDNPMVLESVWLYYGKRNSGKSFHARYVISKMADIFPYGMVMTGMLFIYLSFQFYTLRTSE